MARKRRTRRYFKKTKYSSNIFDIGPSDFLLSTTEGWNATDITLITNPAQDINTTSSVKQIKNVEITMEAEANGSWEGIESIQYYIMFVPEDMVITNQFPMKHPEYIMAYKFYGSPQPEYGDTVVLKTPVRIRSRLARNLNTGDKIVLYIRAANTTNSSKTIQYQGLVRFWTKSN